MPRANDARERTSDVREEEGYSDGVSGDQTRGSAPSSFSALLLREEVIRGLEKEGYLRPSPIQARAIPIGRFGADLIAQAKSGTGKTCMFAVIVLDTLKLDFRSPQALIVAPTRELAHQTRDVVRAIGEYMPSLGCEAFVGGIAINEDVALLQGPAKCCHVVAGTPGRIRALMEIGALAVEGLRQLVLDEADVLLSEAFRGQVDVLFQALPVRKQVIAVSATYTPELLALVRGYMRDPQEVLLVRETASLKGVRQFFQAISAGEQAPGPLEKQMMLNARLQALISILETTSFHQCIVFTNSRGVGQRAASLLDRLGFPARFVCGDQPQKTRLETVWALREFRLRVLVSSDLTSRGLDVDTVNLVINLELPSSHETYLHRVGRTGRFGTLGVAVTMVDSKEEMALLDMASALKIDIQPKPDLIPAELYDYDLGDATEQGKSLRALLETRRIAQEDTGAVKELVERLALQDRPALQKEKMVGKCSRSGVQQQHESQAHEHASEKRKKNAARQAGHQGEEATWKGGYGSEQFLQDDEVVDTRHRQDRGRNLGCLSKGAEVQMMRTEGTKQILKKGWIHAPGQVPGQFWVMLCGATAPELTDVQSLFRAHASPHTSSWQHSDPAPQHPCPRPHHDEWESGDPRSSRPPPPHSWWPPALYKFPLHPSAQAPHRGPWPPPHLSAPWPLLPPHTRAHDLAQGNRCSQYIPPFLSHPRTHAPSPHLPEHLRRPPPYSGMVQGGDTFEARRWCGGDMPRSVAGMPAGGAGGEWVLQGQGGGDGVESEAWLHSECPGHGPP